MKELAGKTAFVTGAASGIGLGIATALSQAGVKVMLCDIDEAAMGLSVKEIALMLVDKITAADIKHGLPKCVRQFGDFYNNIDAAR